MKSSEPKYFKNDIRLRTDPAGRELAKFYPNGIEVADANFPLPLHFEPCDWVGMMPYNHMTCVLAKAGRRLYRARAASIMRTTVYIELPVPGAGGKKTKLYRMRADKTLRSFLCDVDKGDVRPHAGVFWLLPLHKSQGFEGKRARNNATSAARRAGQKVTTRKYIKTGDRDSEIGLMYFNGLFRSVWKPKHKAT